MIFDEMRKLTLRQKYLQLLLRQPTAPSLRYHSAIVLHLNDFPSSARCSKRWNVCPKISIQLQSY
jgi:hypothetical protein